MISKKIFLATVHDKLSILALQMLFTMKHMIVAVSY